MKICKINIATASIEGDLTTEFISLSELRKNVKLARSQRNLDIASTALAKLSAHIGPVAYEVLVIPNSDDFCILMEYSGFKAKKKDFVDDYGNPDGFDLHGEEVGAMYLHKLAIAPGSDKVLPAKSKKGIPFALVCNVKIAKSMQGKGLGVKLYNHALRCAKKLFGTKGLSSNPEDRNKRSNPFWAKYGQEKVGFLDVITHPLPEKFKAAMASEEHK